MGNWQSTWCRLFFAKSRYWPQLSAVAGCSSLGIPNDSLFGKRGIIPQAIHGRHALRFRKTADMANNWNIPAWLELEVRARDKACVYCGTPFTSAKVSKRSAASWEHIINDEKIITRENIALCCCGCNASKGQKPLSLWLQSKYCQERGITPTSVAAIIRQAISKGL